MSRPNIVWLMNDHVLWAHHRRLTGRPDMPTYDRLCATGTRFDNACSVSPVCTPARASMLTGVYPHRHRLYQNDGLAGSLLDFEPDQKLFNHYLDRAGYRCGYFGKWHVGEARLAPDYGWEGFTCEGYGHPYWSREYADYLAEKDLPQAEVEVEWCFGKPEWSGRTVRLVDFPKPYRSPYYLMEAAGKLITPLKTHESHFLAHLAGRWLEDAAQGDDPFCLRVDMWGPHHPYWVGGEYLDSVDPASIPQYPSFNNDLEHRPQHHRDLLDYRRREGSFKTWPEWQPIVARAYEHQTQVDAAIGLVVDRLEELGLMDNTIIMYSADHGGVLGSNGELVDKGWLMVEETIRIPMAVNWPGRTEPGTVNDKLVTNMDLTSTVLEAAGAEMPEVMDGRSLAGLLADPEGTEWPEDLMLQHHGHYAEEHFQRQLRLGKWKYTAHLDDSHELYDLEADPFELTNLINDPAQTDRLADMRRRLRAWMLDRDDNAPDAMRLLEQMGF